MQMAWSARRTAGESRSSVEYTATTRMPRSRHVRAMRSAISPRLAISTDSNMVTSGSLRGERDDGDERGAVLHLRAVRDKHRRDLAPAVGLDRDHELHRLEDADLLAAGDAVTDGDEWRNAWSRRVVEGTDGRRADLGDALAGGQCRRQDDGDGCLGGQRGGRRQLPLDHDITGADAERDRLRIDRHWTPLSPTGTALPGCSGRPPKRRYRARRSASNRAGSSPTRSA